MSQVPSYVAPVDAEAPLLDAVLALVQELANTIGFARALVESGRSVDLAGLDERIGLLCAKTLDLPPEEGRQLRASLISLRDAADALSHALAAPWSSIPRPY